LALQLGKDGLLILGELSSHSVGQILGLQMQFVDEALQRQIFSY